MDGRMNVTSVVFVDSLFIIQTTKPLSASDGFSNFILPFLRLSGVFLYLLVRMCAIFLLAFQSKLFTPVNGFQ